MLRNYLTIAVRALLRNKGFSIVNVLGLASGLGSSMAISLFAWHELTYDSFHENADRIYRVNFDETEKNPQTGRLLTTVSPPMGPALVETYPEVQSAVRLRFTEGEIFSNGEKSFYENGAVYADSTFFEFFSFKLKTGNPRTALNAPNMVVLTEEMAHKYFGEADPIGHFLEMNNEHQLRVTAVLEDLPANSHLSFDFLISFTSFRVPTGRTTTLQDWRWLSFHTYLLLNPDANPAALESKLREFAKTHYGERVERFDFHLQPLRDIYLGDAKNADILSGNRALPYGLAVIGLLILFLVSANYVNLSIARSFRRSKEVESGKSLGQRRSGWPCTFLESPFHFRSAVFFLR